MTASPQFLPNDDDATSPANAAPRIKVTADQVVYLSRYTYRDRFMYGRAQIDVKSYRKLRLLIIAAGGVWKPHADRFEFKTDARAAVETAIGRPIPDGRL